MKTRLLIFAFVPLVFAALPDRAWAANILTLQPADGATNVCPDTLLRLTFDAPPVLGRAGEIRITTAAGELADTIDLSRNDLHNAQPRMIGGMIIKAISRRFPWRMAALLPPRKTVLSMTLYTINASP